MFAFDLRPLEYLVPEISIKDKPKQRRMTQFGMGAIKELQLEEHDERDSMETSEGKRSYKKTEKYKLSSRV
jgi:hypothetical protein